MLLRISHIEMWVIKNSIDTFSPLKKRSVSESIDPDLSYSLAVIIPTNLFRAA